MKTTPVTRADLTRSVIAVPPLCRRADDSFSIDATENRKLIEHLEGGGVSTLLYGGNANLYHIAVSEYDELLNLLQETVADDTWVIPSVGPMFGTILDQAAILKQHDFPTAMVLPTLFPATVSGIQTAVRKFVDTAGMPAVLYIKDESYITPEGAAQLVDDGIISWIKYAIVRENPTVDEYLTKLIDLVDPGMIVSGIGEQPTIAHLNKFGLAGFTSGCICIAPSKSMEVLHALQAGSLDRAEELIGEFKPLEDQRNAHGPIPVLHHAVELAGIADTGPPLPMMSALPDEKLAGIESAARQIVEMRS
ncbi:MAG: dihydrodipicolinate synthase/N-acetylneuraminate lyase [Verrucomicrobiales bacterium]|jgi:dihydrodipicolinate synthase/N-acetylneuraminate lyase